MAEALRERGHEVHVFSPAPMEQHGHSEAAPWAQVYSSLFDLIRRVRSVRADVAVVTGTGWKAMAAVLAAQGHCKKVFFEVMSGARAGTADPRVLANFGFDAVVGQGSPVTRRFVREFGWTGPTETIPALPEPLERHFDIPARARFDVAQGVRFAYFGRVSPPKNVRLLVERFRDYAPEGSILDIWGSGPEVELLTALAAEMELSDRIRLCGRYPEGREYLALLQQYDLLLLPTVAEEGAPLVLLEAMACGLPFAANGMGGIPDYANADCSITDGNIDHFIPAVRTMVERLQAGDVDSVRLQQHYTDHFSFKRLSDRWDAFLRGL
jgi:glycosyltransferase involved in cell wall biosynthesis